MDYEVEYYQRVNESILVIEFLLSLEHKMGAKAFSEIELLQEHWQI